MSTFMAILCKPRLIMANFLANVAEGKIIWKELNEEKGQWK